MDGLSQACMDLAGQIQAVSDEIVPLQAAFTATPEDQGDVRGALKAKIVALKAERAALFVALDEQKIKDAVDAVIADDGA